METRKRKPLSDLTSTYNLIPTSTLRKLVASSSNSGSFSKPPNSILKSANQKFCSDSSNRSDSRFDTSIGSSNVNAAGNSRTVQFRTPTHANPSITSLGHLIRPFSPKSPVASASAFESVEGSDDEDNMIEIDKLDTTYLHTNGNANVPDHVNANGEPMAIATSSMVRSHSVSGDLHGVEPDPVAADILRKEPEQESFVQLRISPTDLVALLRCSRYSLGIMASWHQAEELLLAACGCREQAVLGVRSISTQIVRNRMKSVRNIQRITKAMKMVAASKLRAIQTRAENSRGLWQPFIALLGDTPSTNICVRKLVVWKICFRVRSKTQAGRTTWTRARSLHFR